jgi:hypothetical protein
MKGILLAPLLAVILAVSAVGGLALVSPFKGVTGGITTPSKTTSAGAFVQTPVPATHATSDVQAISSGISNPSLLTALFLVVGAAALLGGALSLVSRRLTR